MTMVMVVFYSYLVAAQADVLIYPAPTPTVTPSSVVGETAEHYCGAKPRKDLSGNAIYPNGRLIQSSGVFYHPNGQALKLSDQVLYPNGRPVKIGDNAFFMSGQNVKIGSTLFYANGSQVNLGSECYFLDRQPMMKCPDEYVFTSDYSISREKSSFKAELRKPYFRVRGVVTYPGGEIRSPLKVEYVDLLSTTFYEIDLETGRVDQIVSQCSGSPTEVQVTGS